MGLHAYFGLPDCEIDECDEGYEQILDGGSRFGSMVEIAEGHLAHYKCALRWAENNPDDALELLVDIASDKSTFLHYAKHLRDEKEALERTVAKLRNELLGLALDTGLRQDIEPPGDWADYPFSEN